MRSIRRPLFILILAATTASCRKESAPDAYGNFEADEVTVSSQASGELRSFTPAEGTRLERGAIIGTVDTVQLSLDLAQLLAQRQATGARVAAAEEQVGVLEAQVGISKRAYDRTLRLAEEKAATAQQVDQAERDYRTLVAQIEAAKSQRNSVASEVGATEARIAQIRDRLGRSRISNPVAGTVLSTFVKEGEIVQAGQPLYKVANLDSLTLRAYVSESQLTSVRLGQTVQVRVDRGDGGLLTVNGVVAWIASKAEFTPTPIQTRDERTDLVYAVKIRVANANGSLKIGMPADLTLPSPAAK
ncbi:MAG TPA: HlyD family efflux transporter periplasmic adaptor subunit [Gemmatimonadaceae bacterium]|nr:HlyD family efflux transporter periplasmic adaptor subunit [Gemmatimonadaceae bacterium]